MNNKAHLRPKDFDSNGDIIPMACKEEKIDTTKVHYVKLPSDIIFIDFDLKDERRCIHSERRIIRRRK